MHHLDQQIGAVRIIGEKCRNRRAGHRLDRGSARRRCAVRPTKDSSPSGDRGTFAASRRAGPPDLSGRDRQAIIMQQLLDARIKDYEQAHLTIDSGETNTSEIIREIIDYYRGWLTLDEN